MANPVRDTKWADVRIVDTAEDGLRGIASLLVVTAHVSRSLAPYIGSPTVSQTQGPILLQLPFIRIFFMGRASVAVFAVLSGYVNALKPIKQLRAGQTDSALAGISKSAFRRTGRFMIPAMVATVMSWLMCQFGGYNLATSVEAQWIRDTSPLPSSSFVAAFADLFHNLITTWTDGGNAYDRIQWTLCYLLRGSMLVYLTLFATAYIQPKFRMLTYAALYYYYWKGGDAVIGFNIYAGLLMAEFTYDADIHSYMTRRPRLFSVGSGFLIFLGLLTISYPEENAEWARWSNRMLEFGHWMFPVGSEYSRFYPGLGSNLLLFGVLFNGTAKKVLSHPYLCWMGKMSFAIYLLHAPLVRTLMTWMLYGLSARPPSPGKNEQGQDLPQPWRPIASWWIVWLGLPLFYFLLYQIARYWVQYVEPWCANATNWIEERVFKDEGKSEKPLLMA